MDFRKSVLIVACGLYGVASSTNTTSIPTPTGTTEPCAVVSAAYASQIVASPAATPTIAAAIAHECLLSVPLGKQAALDLIDSIEPYLEWQTGNYFSLLFRFFFYGDFTT